MIKECEDATDRGMTVNHCSRSMSRAYVRLGIALALISGCDTFLTTNPANCVRSGLSCQVGYRCDADTQRCEKIPDCIDTPAICTSAEFCDVSSRQCLAKHCGIDPSLCGTDQYCDTSSKQCITRAFVLGQPDNVQNSSLAYGMYLPHGVLLVPDASSPGRTRLLVADSGNKRVLIWNDIPQFNRPADSVIGQPDVNTTSSSSYGGVSESSIGYPAHLSSDGVQLAVGDAPNNRVLFFGQIPSQPPVRGLVPALRVFGQSNFQASGPNASAADPSASGITQPFPFFGPGGRFFVSDYSNSRILGFAAPPPGSLTPATLVLGQSDFVSSALAATDAGMGRPRVLSSDGTLLFVPDQAFHRVQVFNISTATNGAKAVAVIGQPNLITVTGNTGGLSASSLLAPCGTAVTPVLPRYLFVADLGNHRVLRYPIGTVPPASLAADLVLGQANMTSGLPNRGGAASASTMRQPIGVDTDGQHLAVSDYTNHRVLIWNTMPTSSDRPADVIVGQPDAVTNTPNTPPTRGPLQFSAVNGVDTDGRYLVVADSANHRVLIWNGIPLDGRQSPDIVLGQPDFSSGLPNGGAAVSASGMVTPNWVSLQGGRLAISDSGNHRILIWNAIPTQSNQPADICLGQASCTTAVAATTSIGLRAPGGLGFMGNSLWVSDTGNNRVLLFSPPIGNGSAASLVVGQQDFVSAGINVGGLSARTLNAPRGVLTVGSKLVVADRGNNRVLIWNELPTGPGTPANVVIGQRDFVTSYTRPARDLIENPLGVSVHQGRLYVALGAQSRILYWNTLPSTNGEPADGVLGQTDFVTTAPNSPLLPPIERLSVPTQIVVSGHQLFVADQTYNRVVVRPLPN